MASATRVPTVAVRGALAIFLTSLAVLVINDWLLKGGGLLPGWLTGKLSDASGMVVAPVVLATALGIARVPPSLARGMAVGAVAVVFAAIKLHGGVALGYDAALNAAVASLSLPLVARTVADRTDLAVLPLLVIGNWATERLARDRGFRRSGTLLAGLLACAATSPSQMRLAPHWGLAGDHQTLWAARIASGAVVVQFGRQSGEGAFEVGVEVAARDGEIAIDARRLVLDLPGDRVPADVPPGQEATVRVARGQSQSLRVVFRPDTTSWRRGTLGVLEIPLTEDGRPRTLRVDLRFDERIVPWRHTPDLR